MDEVSTAQAVCNTIRYQSHGEKIMTLRNVSLVVVVVVLNVFPALHQPDPLLELFRNNPLPSVRSIG